MDPDHSRVLGEIINYGLFLKRDGHRQATIASCVRSLKAIAKQVNLLSPLDVKGHLARKTVSESRKERLAVYLTGFYKFKKVEWASPRYRRVQRLPFIPSGEEVNQLISGMGKKSSCFLQLMKETSILASSRSVSNNKQNLSDQ